MILLAILGWTLVVLVVALLVLLVVPVHLRLVAMAGEGVRLRGEMRLVSAGAPRLIRLETGGDRGRPDREEGGTPSAEKKRRKRRETRGREGGSRAWVRRLMREAPVAAGETLRAVHIDRLRAEGWFGLDDPADTGQFWGLIAPVAYGLGPPSELAIRPSFDRVGIGGEAEARLHFTVLGLIAPGLRLILKVAPWRG